MASVYPAMRGKFGTTEYYIVTMKAGDVQNKLVIPREMPDWEDMELEERFQREINYTRVKQHIAPYLANDEDRFFGSLIVDVINPENMDFEEMQNLSPKVPKLYQTAAQAFGFLTLSGEEMLVPLDGQHRLAAIKFALTGKDEKSQNIDGIDPNTSLATDDVMLILVKHDPIKARKIFNKVNRYAKATSKAENLVTADDDIVAVITREHVANHLIGGRLVNYSSNTLSAKTECFTTLATLYESTKRILEDIYGKVSDQALPDAATQNLYKDTALTFWSTLLSGVNIFTAALSDAGDGGDNVRIDIRKTNLLGKPVAQLALVYAASRLAIAEESNGKRLSLEEIVDRLNEIDWSMDNPMWQHILMNAGKVVSGKQSVNFAARFIAYYLGEPLEERLLIALKDSYLSKFSEEHKSQAKFPERLFKEF
ncbi:MAG: DGQHR domain-containing protein [Candidatus Brocadiales bacterium]|nr:DGQHR domain-containing protein [Candidatus Brocadiales bacterium]